LRRGGRGCYRKVVGIKKRKENFFFFLGGGGGEGSKNQFQAIASTSQLQPYN